MNRSLAQLNKRRKKEVTQFISIKSEQENMTTDTKEIQNIMREYFKHLFRIKLENIGETH